MPCSNVSWRTASGSRHVVVRTDRGQYYGRFSGNSVMLFRLESGLPAEEVVVTGKQIRLSLLKPSGERFYWHSTSVVGSVVGRDDPTTPEARMVTAYAEYIENRPKKQSQSKAG